MKNFSKIIILFSAVMWLSFGQAASAQSLGFTAEPSSSAVLVNEDVVVSLKVSNPGATAFKGFQTTVNVPENLILTGVERGSALPASFVVQPAVTSTGLTGKVNVVAMDLTSPNGANSSTGEIIKLTFRTVANPLSQSAEIRFSDSSFSSATGKDIDVNGVISTTISIIIPLSNISVSAVGSTILRDGQTVQLSAKTEPASATPEITVAWKSDDEDIAKVDPASGLVTAGSKLGTATITATANNPAGNEVSGTISIIVEATPASQVTLSANDVSMFVGSSVDISASVLPLTTTDKSVSWAVKDGSVAKYENGKIYGLTAGTTAVTATCGTVSASCQITVKGADDITVAPGDNTTKGNRDETPGGNTSDGGSLIGSDLTLRVNQTAGIALSIPGNLTTPPNFTWQIDDVSGQYATMTPAENTLSASFKGVAVGETSYSVSAGGIKMASGKIKVIAENPVLALQLDPAEISMAQNALQTTIKPEFTPSEPSIKTLAWTSSEPTVATVDGGVVKPLKVGKTTITATTTDGTGLSAKCEVTVTDPVDMNFDFVFDEEVMDGLNGIAIFIGDKYKFEPKAQEGYVLPDNITWSSDKPDIAPVTNEGEVTGLALGSANITASAEVNGETVSATCTVTVKPIALTNVVVSAASTTTLRAGETVQLSAKTEPASATPEITVAWTSDDEDIAKVDPASGLVTAGSKLGTATITATANNPADNEVKGTIQVEVIATNANRIILNKYTATLLVGQDDQLAGTIEPATTTNPEISWTSDHSDIASVDEKGMITAVKEGTATITATCGQASASCLVTVKGSSDISFDSGSTPGKDEGDGFISGNDVTVHVKRSVTVRLTIPDGLSVTPTFAWQLAEGGEQLVELNPSDDTFSATFKGLKVGVTSYTISIDGNVLMSGKVTIVAEVTMATLSLDPASLSMAKNALPVRINTIYTPTNATMAEFTWTTSDPNVATVGNDGTVNPVGEGSCTITATALDGSNLSASCAVTVTAPIDKDFTFDESLMGGLDGVSIYPGESISLSLKAHEGYDLPKEIRWSSSDPGTVSVDQTGKVTGLAVGTATITATATINNVDASATCKVTVTPVSPTSIDLNIKDMILFLGQSETIQAIVRPDNTTYPIVSWKSQDESVATVSLNGTVTGVGEGVTTITATCGEVSATCTVTVNPIPASKIEIISGNVTLTIGDSTGLVAKVSPANTTHPDVEWSSSDTDIATINADGTVTAVSVGTAVITAKCGNVSDACTVTVIPVLSEGIIVSPNSVSMLLGDELALKASIFPENTTDKNVSWSSDNPTVASVSSNGVVKALNIGSATITASNGAYKAACVVTVKAVEATSISLNVKDETIFVASSTQLLATVSPSNVTDKTIAWTSSKPEIATVSDRGEVYAVSVGTTTVTATIGSVSASCQINVVHRIPDMDPSVTTSARDIVTLSGRPVNMAVYAVGGETSGWSYVWTKDGEVVSQSSELKFTAKNESETVIADIYRVKVENEIDKVVIFSEVFDFVVQIYPEINNPADDSDFEVKISTGSDGSNKTREGNIVTLSVVAPKGGNSKGWEYIWSSSEKEIGEGDSIETVATMSPGNSMSIEETTYNLEMTNYGPEGDVWAQFSSEATLEVYRRPETPLQLLRKGNGTSSTLITMMPLSDGQLEQLGYNFVYGWTDADGTDHIIDVTDLRYCLTEADVYNNSSNNFWVYSIWNYQDGSVVSSGLCYLDGRIDETFDASAYDGDSIYKARETSNRKAVYSIDGQYMGDNPRKLLPGIYIVVYESNGVKNTQKIIIR